MRVARTNSARRQPGTIAGVALACLLAAGAAAAQPAPTITEVRVEQEGRVVNDRLILGLIETTVGEPLSRAELRETYAHLTNLNRFDDVQVFQEETPGGIRLRFVLYPLHPVDRVEYRGQLGLPEGEIRRVLTDRFGAAPSATRGEEVRQALLRLYADRGFPAATVTSRVEETHDPDRATMILDVRAGARAMIARVQVDEFDATDRMTAPGDIGIRAGDPYDAERIQQELDRYETALRARGFYEVVARHTVTFDEATGAATVRITVDRGPRVIVEFAGDPLPAGDRDQLVPIEAERSADEDLLEDVAVAIEEYLNARGYRDATVEYARRPRESDLIITFTVSRGRRYVVDDVAVTGNLTLGTDELVQLLQIKPDEPFIQANLDAGAARIREAYRTRGFTRPVVQPVASLRSAETGTAGDGRLVVRVNVTEGPRTLVGALTFEGNTVLSVAQLSALMTTRSSRPFSEVELVSDRSAIDLEYRNRGYESVVIEPAAAMTPSGDRVDIRVVISEGPQVVVDHVIIVGNDRTSAETIERELLLRSGEPLGYSAMLESQARLASLGLFRRVRIESVGTQPRRDILVTVEEAPPNVLEMGGGIEGALRLRPTGVGGQAEERFEIAPRGSFEIGRRNLWGKNRSINLFTRVSLRSRDIVLSDSGVRLERPAAESGYGFNEYRALLTYREPRVFDTPADLLVTGILDQAIRSSFNFVTREARAEAGLRLPRQYSLAGRYSYQHTRLFDQRFTEAEKPLIDRLFPQVRLSKFTASLIRDTRNDVLDPDAGTFVLVDTQLATRALGSEVGFVKSLVQGFGFYRVPGARRTVLAFGARVGAARGFERLVPALDATGRPVLDAGGNQTVAVVHDLPASERFFAGGDTTVRGFSLDRLGTEDTISVSGFPLGGNGLIVLNSELRVALFGGFGAVAFIDAGNVFPRAADLDITRLRAAAGAGLRYQSPVGPIRIDLGFNLDRRELSSGQLERGSVLHISLGQAF